MGLERTTLEGLERGRLLNNTQITRPNWAPGPSIHSNIDLRVSTGRNVLRRFRGVFTLKSPLSLDDHFLGASLSLDDQLIHRQSQIMCLKSSNGFSLRALYQLPTQSRCSLPVARHFSRVVVQLMDSVFSQTDVLSSGSNQRMRDWL
uniref:Uncharacterized protein n=1 Tax=Setaria digitata TaxID=48799 RepID=A0A915Q5V6_9BILA